MFFAIEAIFFAIEAYNIITTNAIKNFNIASNSFVDDNFVIITFLVDVFKKIDTKYTY